MKKARPTPKASQKHPKSKRGAHGQAERRQVLTAGKQPFIEHVYELRRRLFYIALAVAAGGAVAYSFEQHIVNALLRPAHGQHFIYTSPGGGINFLFSVCLYSGVALSIPVIVYQALRFVEPLIRRQSLRFVAWGSAISGVFALAGIAYGYFLGLPAALHFLLHQFVTAQIRPLLTIQAYMSFVTVYMLGSAMLFQVPLLMVFINRVKPLRPAGLFKKGERWIILFAFVSAGIMNPTPNIFAQLLLAGPIILMYQVGIVVIWLTNRRRSRAPHILDLLERDAQIQMARAAVRARSQYIIEPARIR